MIRASQILKVLSEEYLTRIKSSLNSSASYEVFMNPSQKELREFDAVRFSADSETGKVYAWQWGEDLHPDVRDKLGIHVSPQDKLGRYWSINILEGVATRRGGRFYLESSDVLYNFGYPEEIMLLLSKDWSWVDRYIVVTPYLESYMKKYKIADAPTSDLTPSLNRHFRM
jgi:hypothetical protein